MRAALRALLWASVGASLAVAIAITAPMALGGRPYTVLTGSMRPAIAPGDVVVVRPIAPLDARPGDVVTFRDPQDPRRLITHRVQSVISLRGRADVVTKGDANSGGERWTVPAGGRISRVMYRVPAIGRVAVLARRPGGLLVLVLAPLLLLAAIEVRRIWRPAGGTGDATPA